LLDINPSEVEALFDKSLFSMDDLPFLELSGVCLMKLKGNELFDGSIGASVDAAVLVFVDDVGSFLSSSPEKSILRYDIFFVTSAV